MDVNPRNPEEVALAVSRMVNTLSDDEAIVAFVKAMDNEHRTLQQAFTRLVIGWIKNLAEKKEGWFDARNEASVKLCKRIVEKFGNDLYLPTI